MGREACNLRTKERLRFEAEFAVQMATEIAAKLFELSGVVFIKVAWRLVIHKTAEILAPQNAAVSSSSVLKAVMYLSQVGLIFRPQREEARHLSHRVPCRPSQRS